MTRHIRPLRPFSSSLEPLELRVAPASLQLTAGTLFYSANAGSANAVILDVSGTNLVLTDSLETITLDNAPGFVLSPDGHTATGPESSVARITLDVGDNTDSVTIAADNHASIVQSTGTLNVTLGRDGASGTIRGNVQISAGSGVDDSLTVIGNITTSGSAINITAGGIGGSGLGSAPVTYTGIETINVTRIDSVNLLSTQSGTTTNIFPTGSGTSLILVGSSGLTTGIAGTVNISSPNGPVALQINDNLDPTGRSAAITETSITGLAPAPINFLDSELSRLTVLTGIGADAITIAGVPLPIGPAAKNLIDSGRGSDTITLLAAAHAVTLSGGLDANQITIGGGDLGAITGLVTVTPFSQDTVILDDSGTDGTSPYTISGASGISVTRPGFGGANVGSPSLVILNAQNGANDITITSSLNSGLQINAGGGDDRIFLGDGAHTLSSSTFLRIDGGEGSDQVILNDAAETVGHSYEFAAVTDPGRPGDPFPPDSRASRDQVGFFFVSRSLEGFSLLAGSGDDTFDGRRAPAPVTIDAGSGNDLVIGSPFADVLKGGPGRDTYGAFGVAGDLTITDSGTTASTQGNDTFPNADFEVAKIIGDAGPNHFDASAFSGFVLLDGVSGKDSILGSDVTFAPKSLTYMDVDGDRVTITSTISRVTPENLGLRPVGAGPAALLESLDLKGDVHFRGSRITITAKPGALGGDSFANVGYVDAHGLDLGSLTIPGDLDGFVIGDQFTTVPAIGKLTVSSLFAFSPTDLPAGSSNVGTFSGKIGSLVVKHDVGDGAIFVNSKLGGALGSAAAFSVGGSYLGQFTAEGSVTLVRVNGSFLSGSMTVHNIVGSLTIGGDFGGTVAVATNLATQPATQAKSMVLKRVLIKGSVATSGLIMVGGVSPFESNPDVSMGTLTVWGNWRGSLSVGVETRDSYFGNADDVLGEGVFPFRNEGGNPAIIASIASIAIKGQVYGTFPEVSSTDHFGFVAEKIAKFTVGTAHLKLTAGHDAPIELGPTGDMTVREVAPT